MSYDKQGNKYDLPVFVINEPVEYEKKKVEPTTFEEKIITVE